MRTMWKEAEHRGRRAHPYFTRMTFVGLVSNMYLLTGLSVHMNQVHKESLSNVENALATRQGLDVEIFGMEGIPEDMVQQHNQRIIQNFYQEQADRRAATGNPPPGQSGGQGPVKKLKVETADEVKKRLAEFRAQKASLKANGGSGNTPGGTQSPGQSASPGAFVSLPFGIPLLVPAHAC